MPRHRDPERLHHLAEVAMRVFIDNGYRRTQVADVAHEMGVAKGTVYLYVESKEALFALAAASTDPAFEEPSELPLSTPPEGATVAALAERLEREGRFPALEAAMRRRKVVDPAGELAAIIEELFDVLHRNRRVIKLVDRCAPDIPELSALFYAVARGALPARLAQYVDKRRRDGIFRPLPNLEVVARTLLESVSFWAIHHHWDPVPTPAEPEIAKATLVAMFSAALLEVGS